MFPATMMFHFIKIHFLVLLPYESGYVFITRYLFQTLYQRITNLFIIWLFFAGQRSHSNPRW